MRCCCRHTCRLLATHISAILRTAQLVPEANSADGSTLKISYQLKDSSGRTQIDISNLVIQLELSYAERDSLPPTVQATSRLPNCDISLLQTFNGIGDCNVAVDRKYFPTTGSFAVGITMKIVYG